MRFGNFEVQSFEIQGPMRIKSAIFGDSRGFFTERFRSEEFEKMGLPAFIQENYSRSQAGVLRGLHFQYDKPQGKLVTATRGRILDVAVDIRKQSPTFGKHVKVVLDGQNPEWLWVPAGFAYGFFVLSPEGADVMYKVNNVYNPKGEGAIRWDDPELGISWTEMGMSAQPLLSAKDAVAPSFSELKKNPPF